ISMSLGSGSNLPQTAAAIDYAISKGCFVVAAAGNSGHQEGQDRVSYPGSLPQVITVGSIGKSENPSSFSSSGPDVDVAAPGEQLFSTYKGQQYASLSGTSMATPAVAGICALILGRHPEIDNQAQLQDFLKQHAKDIFVEGDEVRTGAGMPVATNYLDKDPGSAPTPDPDPPTEPEDPVLPEYGLALYLNNLVQVYRQKDRIDRQLEIQELVINVSADKPSDEVYAAYKSAIQDILSRSLIDWANQTPDTRTVLWYFAFFLRHHLKKAGLDFSPVWVRANGHMITDFETRPQTSLAQAVIDDGPVFINL
ncbi:MAG: S8 family serine peptidase, partial [Bacteroidota bacterium]